MVAKGLLLEGDNPEWHNFCGHGDACSSNQFPKSLGPKNPPVTANITCWKRGLSVLDLGLLDGNMGFHRFHRHCGAC